jgi:hypothetical protein
MNAEKNRHRADGKLFSLDIPSYRTFPVSNQLARSLIPAHFATCMALASYVWLIPGERGRRQRLGKVTKQGSPLLRFLWGEAGTHAVRCDPELKRRCQPPLLSSWPLVAPRQVLVTPRQVIPTSAAYSYPRNVISLTASSPAHPGSLHNLFPIGRLKRVSGVHGLRSVGSFFGGRKW